MATGTSHTEKTHPASTVYHTMPNEYFIEPAPIRPFFNYSNITIQSCLHHHLLTFLFYLSIQCILLLKNPGELSRGILFWIEFARIPFDTFVSLTLRRTLRANGPKFQSF